MCLPLSSLMHSLSKKSVSAFDSWIISTPVELEKIVVTTTKHFYSGKNTLLISGQLEDNIGIDLGGLMKLFNQFNILPKYLTAFNYAGLNLNETPKEIEQCPVEFQTYWDKECKDNPTNQNCLIYCDWS